VLDRRPLRARQQLREIGEALVSILIFGVGILVPWWLLKSGWAAVRSDASTLRIVVEMGVLLLWNELHFYAHHRLLHTRWAFPRFHIQHHRSHVTTPFSTYAFHPVEAAFLGSVPLLPMLAWSFSWQALFALPILSLAINSIGHANYDAFPAKDGASWLTAGRRHHLHHACFRGNYGFFSPLLDRLCGTALPDEAADAILKRAATDRHAA